MKKILLSLILLLGVVSPYAQLHFEKRIEIEKEVLSADEKINVFGEDGFVITSKISFFDQAEQQLKYRFFNAEMNLTKTVLHPLDKKYFPQRNYPEETKKKYFESSEYLHQLYKNRQGDFALVTINPKTFEVNNVTGLLPNRAILQQMVVVEDLCFFHLTKKNKDLLVSVNWKNGEQRQIPIDQVFVESKKNSIRNLQILEESKELLVYLETPISKKEKDLLILRLNEEGEILHHFNLSQKVSRNIVYASAAKVGVGHYIFTGTYSTDPTKEGNLSEGLFYAHVMNSELRFIKFYNYLDLKEFINYLPPEDLAFIKQEKRIESIKGKELKLYYSLLSHQLQLTKDGSLFMAEVYYPVYKSENSGGSGVNGTNPWGGFSGFSFNSNYDVVAGHQYTHVVIAKFDAFGNLIWDKMIKTDRTYQPRTKELFLSSNQQNANTLNVVLANDKELLTNSINPTTGIAFRATVANKIVAKYPNDDIQTTISKVVHWYEDFYLVYGYQKIKNRKDRDVKRNRTVLFANKIEYRQSKASN